MKSRSWLPLAVLLGLASGAYAQPFGYAPPAGPYGTPPAMQALPMPGAQPAPAADPREAMRERLAKSPMVQATNTLKEGMDKLLEFMRQEETPNKLQVAAFLDKEIAPYFDFDYMAKWVAGPGYARMSPEQRKAMASRLEASFLSGLSTQLASYEGQQVRMLRPRMGPRGAVSVNVGILRPGSYPSKLEFRMYKSDDGWKVYDVVANGRSAASYYRVQYQRGARAPAGR
ncbi:MAG: phospholipid-binding protein MlaC [Bdellovibrio bacteriovorus]